MKKGLRTVALLEASKGVVSLIVGLGIHKLAGKNIQDIFESLLSHLPLNPESRLSGMMMEEAGKLASVNLTLIEAGAMLYAVVRFIEAYGLWNEFLWTEWFALLSGGIYLPFEIYEVIHNPGAISVGVLLINLIVVGYMYVIIREKKHDLPEQNMS